MAPRSWERSVKLPVTQLQLFLHNKDRFSQDFNIKLTDSDLPWCLHNKDRFLRDQVLRTQYTAASDSTTIIPA
jgi:hypothetical protein